MKPVLEKNNYYNLILMRDDAGVKTWRLKRATLKFLIGFLVAIFILAVAGVSGTILIGKRYFELSQKNKSQEALLAEARLQLERLSSLETLLQASENGNGGTKSRNAEVGLQASTDAATGQGQGVVAPAGGAASNTEAAAIDSEAQNGTAGSANGEAAELSGGAAAVPASGQPDSLLPLISSDGSPVKIAGMNIRAQGNRRFRVRYELHSKDQPNQLSGSVEHLFIMDDGSRVTPKIPSADTRFSIQYMKAMENTLRLPDEADPDRVKALEIIVAIGQNKYGEIFNITTAE